MFTFDAPSVDNLCFWQALLYISLIYTQRILKTVNIEVRHRFSNKLHSSPHTHKDRKHKNTQPGVYKIPCECGKVYIGETGRSSNTIIKEHKACQRLGDGDKLAIVGRHWEDSSLITSIPHWHTRRVREAIEILQHNTVPQDSGLHINAIFGCPNHAQSYFGYPHDFGHSGNEKRPHAVGTKANPIPVNAYRLCLKEI